VHAHTYYIHTHKYYHIKIHTHKFIGEVEEQCLSAVHQDPIKNINCCIKFTYTALFVSS